MNTSTLFSGAVRNAFDSARRKSDETCRPSAKITDGNTAAKGF